jgi:hypothetical protein
MGGAQGGQRLTERLTTHLGREIMYDASSQEMPVFGYGDASSTATEVNGTSDG